MKTLTFVLTALVITTLTVAAQQGPPVRPAGRGLTTNSTWTDDDLEKMMKQINTGATTLRKLIDETAAPAAEAQADTLQHLFDDVEEFWQARKVEDAEKWAVQAEAHAGSIEDAAKAKNFAKAGEHLKLLMGVCEQCHTKYREQATDGSYQLKKQ
jgi:hypothetical protein